jgi:YegS/Rv2252/BmrU family lipid kinase
MGQLKTFLVVNPRSSNGATGRRFSDIAVAVRDAIGTFEHAFTSRPMEAAELAARALKDGYECVVSVGGDGTVNEVVNGFFEGGRPIREGAVLGVIPRGTGGDFRKSFGWTTDLREAAERLKGDGAKPLDVGRVDFVGNDGREVCRYFANIASAGVSGQVDYEVNRASKALGGKATFAIGSLRAMLKYRDRKVRLSLDDAPPKEHLVTTLAVANGQYFGGGMWVAPDARPDDGRFDITLWTGYRLMDFVVKSAAIYNGGHVHFPGTLRFSARKVRAESNEEVLLDIDGEQPGRLPATFEVVPGAIRLKV